jgi:hypothetical protein
MSLLQETVRPLWPEYYRTGYASLEQKKWPPPNFKKQMLMYNYTINTGGTILKNADNTVVKMPQISKNVKILEPSRIMLYENFSNSQTRFSFVSFIFFSFFIFFIILFLFRCK